MTLSHYLSLYLSSVLLHWNRYMCVSIYTQCILYMYLYVYFCLFHRNEKNILYFFVKPREYIYFVCHANLLFLKKNRLCLEQFEVHSKIEQEVQSSHTLPAPSMHSLPHCQHPPQER